MSFVLGSKTMDRHLTYVAMTRHREDTMLYLDEAAQKRLFEKSYEQPKHSRSAVYSFDRDKAYEFYLDGSISTCSGSNKPVLISSALASCAFWQ